MANGGGIWEDLQESRGWGIMEEHRGGGIIEEEELRYVCGVPGVPGVPDVLDVLGVPGVLLGWCGGNMHDGPCASHVLESVCVRTDVCTY